MVARATLASVEKTDLDVSGFVGQLMALPSLATQRCFLANHADDLTDRVADALKAQADQFLRADIQRSLQTAYLLCEMAAVADKPAYRALSLLAEANAVSIGLGQYQRGIELYDQAAGIYQAQDDPVGRAKAQVGKIGSLEKLGRYQEALEIAGWVEPILAAHSERRSHATLIMNLGIIYERLGELNKALEMHDQAGEIYRQLGPEGEAGWLWTQQNRAIVLRLLGQFEASIQTAQIAREGLTRLGQKVSAARARQILALTYFVQGRYNEALEHLDDVRNVFLNDGRQRDAVLVELFISDCLLQLRRFTDVIEKCSQVRNLFNELGARYVAAQAVVNEAVAYAELGRYEEAVQSLAEARSIFAEGGNRVWLASTDLETAAVLLRQGRYEDSLKLALACAVDFQSHNLPVEETQARLVAARAALTLNRREQAAQLAAEVLRAGESRNLPRFAYRGHQLMAALASAENDLQAALDECDRAILELERLRGRLMIEFRAGFLEDKEAIYEDAVDFCLALDRPRLGLEYAERAKSRALLDMLAQRLDLSVQARDETDRPLVEDLVRLRARHDQVYRRWEGDEKFSQRGWTTSSSERQQAQQEVLALEKQITELWHRLLIRNADYARDAALWHVRIEPIQPYLSPGTLLLEYFVVHGELVAFLVSGDELRSVRLPIRLARVQQLVQLLWMNLRLVPRSTSSQIVRQIGNARALLKQLYNALIAPLAEGMASHPRLIVVPHGPLHYLPFHALYDGATYLLERHEISYLPGGSFLRYCLETQPVDTGLVAIGHSCGGRLPHTLHEAVSVAELMRGLALLENEATVERFQAMASDCRVLHLAAHGDFRPDNPLFSGLSLADGWLTTLDIFNLRLRASLVTLSACRTGRSVVGGGDELLGLMRAFLSAGAASLLLSLWAVEDHSTAQLMKSFYQKMSQGHTKGSALREAQMQFIAGGEVGHTEMYTHPYFWAPFFLVGDAGRL